MSKFLLGLILLLFASLKLRAEQPTFTITSLDATPGEIIDIDFHVDNFGQLISVQFSVNWNPNVLEFRAIKNFNASVPGLSLPVFGTPQPLIDSGKFTLSWFESNNIPITIPDGSLFFTVEFEVIGAPCQSSAVAITDDPLEIEVAEDDVDIGLVANNGTVTIPGTGCVEDIHFTGNSVIGPCSGSACIQFTVENFVTVGTMEFSLSYDPAVLQFIEFKNFAPLPSFGAGNTNLLTPGTLRVLWFNGNAENDTLPDGTVLFEICFNVIGTGGQSSEITFGNNPPVMISDIDENFHNVTITPAVITAQCQLEGFALITDTVCTMPDGIVCFDIQVNDFDDIVALQFSMSWDSNVFIFDHLEGFGIPGLDENGFGTPGSAADVDQGELTISWIDLSLEGVTLPDFTTIFRLCLKAVGAAGTATPLSFATAPLEIEVLNSADSLITPTLIHGRGEIQTSCEGCSAFSYTLFSTNPTCPGGTNGVLNLTVIENCPENATYLWSHNNATTEDLTGIGAGIYTVTITLGNQLVIVKDTLVDPAPIEVNASQEDPDPLTACNGSIDITVNGGTPPYTYQWSTPPGGNTQDLTNLCKGTYTVTVTDNTGCVFVPDSYILGAEFAADVDPVTCNGGADGAINLAVSFGTGPYTFVWNTTPVSTTEDLNNLTARDYCVTVTDSGGSTRDTCFTVTQPSPLLITSTVVNDADEDCHGAIDLNVTGGTQPYCYAWSNGATTQDLTNLCGGDYTVTVSYGSDCACSTETTITVFTGNIVLSLDATQYGNYEISCNGLCDGEITAVVQGGNNPTYQWSNGFTTPTISNLCAGTYTVTVTDQSAGTITASIILDAPNPFALSYITTNPSDFITSDGAISVIVNGGSPAYTYQWTGPVNGNTASLNNVPAGTYTIQVTDANGCIIRDSEQLIPDTDVPCYSGITLITPNNDDRNDYFIISCVYDLDNRLFIYNRFGGLVYETDNYDNNWNGIDQDNEPVPDGGYLWILQVFRLDGSTDFIKGTVNVLRTAD